jgi:hypothetical protein
MGEGLRYSTSDCFAPFPFPARDPKTSLPELDDLGEEVHEIRREFAMRRGIGLTETYNVLHDAKQDADDVVALRQMHENLDRAVLDAYGWGDVAVPAYCGAHGAMPAVQGGFEDAVAERLFNLNAERAMASARPADGSKPGIRQARERGPGTKKPRAKLPGIATRAKP